MGFPSASKECWATLELEITFPGIGSHYAKPNKVGTPGHIPFVAGDSP
ncbi:hypothetical protein [Ulvibacterium sp.]